MNSTDLRVPALEGMTNSERLSMSCRHRWMLKYGFRLSRRFDRGPAATLGSAIHAGLAHRLSGGSYDSLEDYIRGEVVAAHAHHVTEEGLHSELEMLEDARTKGLQILQDYESHWSSRSWKVLGVEQVLQGQINGYPVSGMVDAVIETNSGIWVVDHKTTQKPLDLWVQQNPFHPQSLQYMHLVEDNYGERPRGIIYNLIRTVDRVKAIKRLKSGQLQKPRAGSLPRMTAPAFREFITQEALEGRGKPAWDTAVMQQLEERDRSGYWFHEERREFSAQEMKRAADEISVLSEQRALDLENLSGYSEQVDGCATEQEAHLVITRAVRRIGHRWPRNPKDCFKFNRPCEYMDFCRHQLPDGLTGFEVRPTMHREFGGASQEVKGE